MSPSCSSPTRRGQVTSYSTYSMDAVDVTVDRVAEMDRRWRLARDVQRETINRLLADRGRTLDQEHDTLTAEVVELRARVERVVDMLVGRRGSNVAKQVLAVLEPDEG